MVVKGPELLGGGARRNLADIHLCIYIYIYIEREREIDR